MKYSELYDNIFYDIDKYPKLYMYILEMDNSVREVCFPVEQPERYQLDSIVKRNIGKVIYLDKSDYEYASKRLYGEIKKKVVDEPKDKEGD